MADTDCDTFNMYHVTVLPDELLHVLRVVMDLMSPSFHVGYHVYFKNLFTSVALMEELEKRKHMTVQLFV